MGALPSKVSGELSTAIGGLTQEDSMTEPPTRPRSRRLRRLIPGVVVGLTAPIVAVAISTPSQAALRTPAASINKFIGYAANAQLLCNNSATCTSGSDATYRSLAGTEFNQVTHENALKWEATEPNDNQYTFTQADGVVAFAQANNQIIHGHTLVWHSQTPGWVQGLSATAMRAAMQEHISTVVGRYANNPALRSWDVVNEVIGDNGQLRTSFWLNTMGESYIADAFRFARAADPDAALCINDYSIEGQNAKSNRLFQLVQSLLSQNVPVTCVGFQAHLIVNQIPGDFQANLQRFANLGLQVRITELDIRIPLPADNTELQQQANNYATVVNVCRAVAACSGITLWGIDDGHSWLPNSCCPEGAPLLWNASYQQKPAYASVNSALGGTTTTTTTTTTRPPSTTTTRPPSTTTTTRPPSTTTTTTRPPTGTPGGCTATYQQMGQWGGGQPGFQGQVTVTNTGSTSTSSWSVVLTFANGQRITQIWDATTNTQGQSPYTANNASYNPVIAPNASRTFGFLGSWNNVTNSAPALSCSRT
jgi:endo-1,4-beta-xylanase